MDGFRVNALDYLLKPISYADFLEACNKALQWFQLVQQNEQSSTPAQEEPTSIFVKSEYKLLQIQLDDIKYIEGLKDYVKIYTEQSQHPILTLMNMKAIEQMLPPSRFIRVHRSFIVQKSKIPTGANASLYLDEITFKNVETQNLASQGRYVDSAS